MTDRTSQSGFARMLRSRWSWMVVAAAAAMFFANLGGARLWDDDEPKNASCGHEMLERGDFVTPMFNYQLRPHKPAMLYWCMIASYSALGVSEFAARLPSALASICTVLLTFHIGRMLFDRTIGLVAALLLCSGLMFAVLSRAATPDGLLILFSTLAMFAYVWGISRGETGGFGRPRDADQRMPVAATVGMYLAMGLAVLTKGPIGVLMPLSAITAFALFGAALPADKQEPSRFFSWLKHRLQPGRVLQVAKHLRVASGLGIVLLTALPWYVAVSSATSGEWIVGFFGTHNVGRFLSPMEGHRGPIFYHLISVTAGLFPGSCFLPVAVVAATATAIRRTNLHQSYAYLLLWAAAWITFFSIAATKLPNYSAPSYPPLALLTGTWLITTVRRTEGSLFWLRAGFASLTLVGGLMIGGMLYAAPIVLDGDYLLALLGVAPVLGGVAALWTTFNPQRVRLAPGVFVASCLLFTVVALGILAPRISGRQTSHRVAAAIQAIEANSPDTKLQVAAYSYTKPNLVFYLQREVTMTGETDRLTEFLQAENAVAVLTSQQYQRIQAELPYATQPVATFQRFLKPGESVVIIARAPSVALRAAEQTLLK